MNNKINISSNNGLDFIIDYRKVVGDGAVDMLYRLKIIEKLLEKQNKPHLFIQILKNFLFSISSQDPTPFHYELVRKFLNKNERSELNNTDSVDLLSRSFVVVCNKLNKKLKYSESLNKLIEQCRAIDSEKYEKPSYYLDFVELPEANVEFEKLFFKENGLSIWDNNYYQVLKSIGPEAIKCAQQFIETIKEKKDGWDQHFWFKKPNDKEPFYHSPALLILVSMLWEDDVKKRVKFAKKQVPALTTSINEPIGKILSHKNTVVKSNNQLQLLHQESLIGTIPIPAIPQKFFNTVFNGFKKLNTVTGHRFIRYLVISSYNQMINGNTDYRVLRLNRGASEIAEHLHLNGKKHITNIKEIVHAMTYCEFRNLNMSGNLIQLTKDKSPITGREDEAYLITIGTPLLPYQAFEANKRGECSLLIPLLKDPPLVGSSRYHAGQYLLQMKIMEEFSSQSVDLFNNGCIEITEDQWINIAQSCGLNPEVLLKIQARWTKDGDDGGKFLERVDDDYFTLGKEHNKALIFLKDQGKLRILQSRRGVASDLKRKKAKQEKNSQYRGR